jgi:hypothetical protein
MKKIMSAIAKLTLAAMFIVTVVTVQAQTNVPDPAQKNAEVKYLGTDNGVTSFNVVYDNPSGNKFAVIVFDKEDTQLYQEFYSDKKFDKKFRFIDPESSKLTFIIRSAKDGNIIQSFELNKQVKEDLSVTKLK